MVKNRYWTPVLTIRTSWSPTLVSISTPKALPALGPLSRQAHSSSCRVSPVSVCRTSVCTHAGTPFSATGLMAGGGGSTVNSVGALTTRGPWIKPQMTWPAICNLLLGLYNGMEGSPPHSGSVQSELAEPLLHSACSPLGSRGFGNEQSVVSVLEESHSGRRAQSKHTETRQAAGDRPRAEGSESTRGGELPSGPPCAIPTGVC